MKALKLCKAAKAKELISAADGIPTTLSAALVPMQVNPFRDQLFSWMQGLSCDSEDDESAFEREQYSQIWSEL